MRQREPTIEARQSARYAFLLPDPVPAILMASRSRPYPRPAIYTLIEFPLKTPKADGTEERRRPLFDVLARLLIFALGPSFSSSPVGNAGICLSFFYRRARSSLRIVERPWEVGWGTGVGVDWDFESVLGTQLPGYSHRTVTAVESLGRLMR